MNCVQLVGNLGSDPETRTTGGGMVICTLRLATESREKVGDEWEKVTAWHRVVVFGKQAENCAQYLSKGKKVGVIGKIKYRQWEDKDSGATKYMTEIIADNVEFLSPRGDDGERQERDEPRREKPKDKRKRDYDQPDDEELPF